MFNGGIITEETRYFFCPIITIFLLRFIGGGRRLRVVLIPVFELIADGHILIFPLLVVRVGSHSIVRTLVVSEFVGIQVILFEVLVASHSGFAIMFIRSMNFISRAAVVGGTAAWTLESRGFLLSLVAAGIFLQGLAGRLLQVCLRLCLYDVHSVHLNLRILFVDVRPTDFLDPGGQCIHASRLKNLLRVFSLIFASFSLRRRAF